MDAFYPLRLGRTLLPQVETENVVGMNAYRHVRGAVVGRERRRLRSRFPILNVQIDDHLHERLLAHCGSEVEFGLELGRVLHRHCCGVWGPIPVADRVLNEFVMGRVFAGEGDHYVVSRHRLGPFDLRIATDLRAGIAFVRLFEPLS